MRVAADFNYRGVSMVLSGESVSFYTQGWSSFWKLKVLHADFYQDLQKLLL